MEEEKKLSILIVGQGLAGSILADRLIARGTHVHLVDKAEPSNASKIAAGIVNPITGRRFVLSWMIEDLIASLISYYQSCEQKFNATFLEEKIISRTLNTVQEINNWEERASLPAYGKFMVEDIEVIDRDTHFNTLPELGHIEGFQVNVPELVQHFRSYFVQHEMLDEATFDAEALTFEGDQVLYIEKWFDKVVFCEGWAGQHNPFFNYLPFNLSLIHI